MTDARPPESEPRTGESAADLLKRISRSSRGRFKLFIGMAPGVGKTYKMLQEAHERFKQGEDLVVGVVETHGRVDTQALIGDLPQVPRKRIDYKGVVLEEMDLDAVVARKPRLVLVDELAHTNVPGSARAKRYQDVEELLAAGIDVLSTLNIQHLESLNDVVERITGVKVRETVPDAVLKQADEVVLVDLTPEELRQRLVAGKVYAPDRIHQSLQGFFRPGNLQALRELALRELADTVDVKITEVSKQGLAERILVCLAPVPSAARLVRRGARMAERLGAELIVLSVKTYPLGGSEQKVVNDLFRLAAELEATVVALDRPQGRVSDTIIQFARENHVTQIVLGETRRSLLKRVLRGSIIRNIINRTKDVDILIVAENREE